MSVAAIGIGGAVMAGATAYSAYKGGQAADKAAGASAADLAFQRDQFDYSKQNFEMANSYFDQRGSQSNQDFNTAVGFGMQSYGTAKAQSQAYNQFAGGILSGDIGGEIGGATGTGFSATAAKVDFSGFLNSFSDAMVTNGEALETFNRRYGPIMDNVAEGIENVSQARLSASGREQMSLDMETMGNQFKSQMAASGMGRSGMAVETEQRMAMQAMEQGRAIDIAAYEQAGVLQAQGVNTLNSMENQRQGIYQRSENIDQNKGQGLLQGAMTNASNATNASIATAANKTQASISNANMANQMDANKLSIAANMFGRGFNNELQASNNVGNLFSNRSNTNLNAQNAFYGNMGMPSATGVSNAYQNSAAQSQADAGGWMQTAGSLLGSDAGQSMLGNIGLGGS